MELSVFSRRRAVGVMLGPLQSAIAWHDDRGRLHIEQLPTQASEPGATVSSLLARLPLRNARCHVVVAVGKDYGELRRIDRLPRGLDATSLTNIVRADPGRFFPRAADAWILGGVAPREPGTLWVAAVGRATLHQVAIACAHAGVRLAGLIPAAALTRDADDPESLARFAATQGARSPFLVRDGVEPQASSARIITATKASVMALVFAITAPPLTDLVRTNRSEQALRALEGKQRIADVAVGTLARRSAELAQLDAFVRGAPSLTLRLASLSRHLDESAMLTSLQVDSTGGSLVALASSASDLTDMLAGTPEVADVRILGPIVTEAAVPAMMAPQPGAMPAAPIVARARVTVRFAWERNGRPTATPPIRSAP